MTAVISPLADAFKSSLHISNEKHSTPAPATLQPESIKKAATAQVSSPPDINYAPDEAKWKARTARRLAEDPTLPQTPLPTGFPSKLDSPLVWEGKDWTDSKVFEFDLSSEQLKEIDDALRHFTSLNVPTGHLSPSTFPLPTLGSVLKGLSNDLHNGRGFFVLRTIPVDQYTREENVIIYAGVSSWIGALRGLQDSNGGVLAHIKDLSEIHPAKTIGAPAYTTDKQVFHTDAGDIISLYVLDTAEEGGTSRISSSWRVYNELAETRPDLIKTLSEPWVLDTFGAGNGYVERPILFHHNDHIIIQYARRIFTGFQGLPRSTTIPHITEAQAEALDALHFIAEKHALGLGFQKGDIQYINNLSIFHGRDGFRDGPEHTRHLLRLWLRDEDLAWERPAELQAAWQRLYYSTSADEQRFPLEPVMRDVGGRGAKYD